MGMQTSRAPGRANRPEAFCPHYGKTNAASAETESGEEALRLLEDRKPDLLVTEVTLSPGSGLELLARVRAQSLPTRTLVLTDEDEGPYVSAAFRLGAQGYSLKSVPPRAVEAAVRAVLSGERYLTDRLPRSLIDPPTGDAAEAPNPSRARTRAATR